MTFALVMNVSVMCLNVMPCNDDAMYTTKIKNELNRLQDKYSEFRDNLTFDMVKDVKDSAKSLILTANTPEKKKILAKEIVDNVSKSSHFRYYEYFLFWYGSRVGMYSQKVDVKFILKVADKINSRSKIKDKEVRNEVCAMSISMLDKILSDNDLGNVIRSGLQIDWKAWGKFDKKLRAQHKSMVYDVKIRRYRFKSK
ncbi:MAG: hypothetical protein Tsb009_36840 [Planctomycetaceae bacterium]